MTIVPTDNDVLCGKDKACLQAKGSRRFRDVIDSWVPKYTTQCHTKFDKMQVTRAIYDQVVGEQARFLKFNDKEQVWEEISAMAARDKIGHSLRFSSRAKRRHKKTHKRSGSASSCSSSGSETNPFAADSLVGLLKNAAALKEPITAFPSLNPSSSSIPSCLSPSPVALEKPTISTTTVSSFFSSNPLDDFLELEIRFDSNEGAIYSSMDDFKLLIEEEKIEADPLDNFMDDILNVVKAIEADNADTENDEKSLLSLYSEPVGEWEEDRRVELS